MSNKSTLKSGTQEGFEGKSFCPLSLKTKQNLASLYQLGFQEIIMPYRL